jgi:histone H3
MRSGALTTDSAGELDVLWHDGDSLGVDGAEVGVFEETDQVGLGGFLEGEDSGALESEVVLVLSGNFTNESLEWELADEELGTLLESSDFTEGNGTWSESMGFLDTTGGGGLLGSSLVGDVLSWVL